MNEEKLPKVFVAQPMPSVVVERLKGNCSVTMKEDEPFKSYEEFLKALPADVEALIVTPYLKISKETLDAAGPQLKVVGTFSVGLDHIDLEECKRRGVKVGYTPDVLTNAVAELTVALTLATARRLEEAFQSVKTGVWGKVWNKLMWMVGKQVSNSVIGIVGLGRIGLATAKRLVAFEPSKIIYCGSSPRPEAKDIHAEFVSFDELLAASDFVIATCSINQSTTGLFGARAFKRMKSTAVFINVTRGALVDQEALYEALSTNQIGAAGLDVTSPEPLPIDHKLLSLKNCLVTPHIGSATVATRDAMFNLTVDNVLAGLQGHPLPASAY